jgi:hypothetical protein
VLAIRATPPEIVALREPIAGDPSEVLNQLDPTSLATDVEVLAVDPRDPQREVDWELWVCSSEESFCKEESALRERIVARRTTLDQIRHRFEPTPQQLLGSFNADPLRGFGGMPLTLEFRLVDREDVIVRAFKRVVYTFWLPYSPVPRCKRANRSPRLRGVVVEEQGLFGAEEETAPFRFDAGEEIVLDPRPTGDLAAQRESECPQPLALQEPPPEAECEERDEDESRETYWVVTAEDTIRVTSGDTPLGARQLCEYLSYDFFTTAGELSHATTGGSPSPFVENKKIADPTATFTAPGSEADSEAARPAELWVVIRDGRGGTDWVHFAGQPR